MYLKLNVNASIFNDAPNSTANGKQATTNIGIFITGDFLIAIAHIDP